MPQVWKVSPLGRIGCSVLLAAAVVFDLLVSGVPSALIVLAVGGALVWLSAFWPSVTLTETELIVRNPWGVTRVPLGDIADTGGAYAGLSIKRRSGGRVAIWAVQKSNAAKMAKRTTRADEVAATIKAAARRAPKVSRAN
ncbi:MAG: PH domain-containing protein [Actinoplanes sp.]